MAQSGYTPILIYASGTASALPSAANLTSSANGAELALNYADGKLYYKNSSGVVTLLASAAAASGTSPGGSTTQVQYNNAGAFGGSANFVWDNSNVRLGIGTSSPQTLLQISSVTPIFSLYESDGAVDEKVFDLRVNSKEFLIRSVNDAYTAANNVIAATRSTGIDIDNVRFFTGAGSERMRIDSSGRVGIGVTPSTGSGFSQRLQIKQADGIYSGLQIQKSDDDSILGVGYWTTTAAFSFVATYTSTGSYRPISFVTSGTERVRIGATGGLIVGSTIDPGSGNILVPSNGTIFGNNSSNSRSYIELYNSSTGDMSIATTYTSAAIKFLTGGTTTPTERMRIDSSGNVGIGLTPVANNGILQLNSYGAIKALIEGATVSATQATGTIAYDAATQAVLYYTGTALANWTVNFRGSGSLSLNSMMQTGQSLTLAFLVTQGATAYYNSAVQVDGTSVTPKWQGGTAPTAGNASSIDSYVYTIIKTGAATFTVLASQTKFA